MDPPLTALSSVGSYIETIYTIVITRNNKEVKKMIALDKEKIINSLRDLPDKTTIEEAMERLYLLAKIEKGIIQADDGQCISHEEAKEKMKKWLR